MLYIKEDATNDLQELASAKPTPRVQQQWYKDWHVPITKYSTGRMVGRGWKAQEY